MYVPVMGRVDLLLLLGALLVTVDLCWGRHRKRRPPPDGWTPPPPPDGSSLEGPNVCTRLVSQPIVREEPVRYRCWRCPDGQTPPCQRRLSYCRAHQRRCGVQRVTRKYCCPGYVRQGNSCVRDTQCDSGNGGCEQMCVPAGTGGTARCGCLPGFTLFNNTHCADIDECATNMGGCSDQCKNTEGSFFCTCPHGYALYDHPLICQEVDECSLGNGGCEHYCQNTDGAFYCECQQGHTLVNGFSCQDNNNKTSHAGGLLGLSHTEVAAIGGGGATAVLVLALLAIGLFFLIKKYGCCCKMATGHPLDKPPPYTASNIYENESMKEQRMIAPPVPYMALNPNTLENTAIAMLNPSYVQGKKDMVADSSSTTSDTKGERNANGQGKSASKTPVPSYGSHGYLEMWGEGIYERMKCDSSSTAYSGSTMTSSDVMPSAPPSEGYYGDSGQDPAYMYPVLPPYSPSEVSSVSYAQGDFVPPPPKLPPMRPPHQIENNTGNGSKGVLKRLLASSSQKSTVSGNSAVSYAQGDFVPPAGNPPMVTAPQLPVASGTNIFQKAPAKVVARDSKKSILSNASSVSYAQGDFVPPPSKLPQTPAPGLPVASKLFQRANKSATNSMKSAASSVSYIQGGFVPTTPQPPATKAPSLPTNAPNLTRPSKLSTHSQKSTCSTDAYVQEGMVTTPHSRAPSVKSQINAGLVGNDLEARIASVRHKLKKPMTSN